MVKPMVSYHEFGVQFLMRTYRMLEFFFLKKEKRDCRIQCFEFFGISRKRKKATT